MKNKTLNDYKENIFSQYGEDGIVKEILRRLAISGGACIEFGAWDGVQLANTAILWTKNNWRGILIEAGEEKFETLKKVVVDYDCLPLNDFVTPSGPTSIENILRREKVNFEDIKILSVDIDGNEYHILNGLTTLLPPLIIAEHNPTIPLEMDIVSKEDAFFGSSATALTRLMESKGYILVAMTTSNCFFVDKKYADLFSDLDINIENLFDRTRLTYLITGYKGAYTFSRAPAYGIGLPLDKNLIASGDLFYISYSSLRVRWNYLKQAIKEIGKKILGAQNILSFKNYCRYVLWKLKGMPIPAHGIYKWHVIKKYAKKYGVDIFLETGTAGGGTVLKLSKFFKKLYTIELDPTLYHQGKVFVSDYKNIVCIEGDSGIMIKEILQKVNEPIVFWLDAHYSGQGTARGAIDTPIVQELQSIFKHRIKDHVILIDDAREFNGTNDYPELSELKKIIKNDAPWYKVSQDNDIIIIEPTQNK